MKIKSANASTCRNCLNRSVSVETMIRFAKLVIPRYDIYKQMGLKAGMPISPENAARCIVEDLIQNGYYVDFVEALIRISKKGYMGRKYTLMGLKNVVDGLIDEGYSFDKVSGQFFENQEERISPNWGRLQEGDERKMTMLRVDIAGNSELTRSNPHHIIEKTYNDIRKIVERAVISRYGRLWYWEGDGALAAFLFGAMENLAVYAGMEILHELYFYNRLRNNLDSPVNMRLGAHIGQVWYSDDELDRLKNETVKQTTVYEESAVKNSLCLSYNLFIAVDPVIQDLFGMEKKGRDCNYRLYTMRAGK